MEQILLLATITNTTNSSVSLSDSVNIFIAFFTAMFLNGTDSHEFDPVA